MGGEKKNEKRAVANWRAQPGFPALLNSLLQELQVVLPGWEWWSGQMSQGGEKQMGKGSSQQLYKPLEHPQMEQLTTGLELFLAQAGHRHPTLA